VIDFSVLKLFCWVARFVRLDAEEGREFRPISGKLKSIVTGCQDQLELSVNFEVGCVTNPPVRMATILLRNSYHATLPKE